MNAMSNPIIVSDLINAGRFDDHLPARLRRASRMSMWPGARWMNWWSSQVVFLPVWQETRGNDGYVSFELDPLLEDASCMLVAY